MIDCQLVAVLPNVPSFLKSINIVNNETFLLLVSPFFSIRNFACSISKKISLC